MSGPPSSVALTRRETIKRIGAAAFRQKAANGRTVLPFHLRAGGQAYCMPDIKSDALPPVSWC